MKLELLVIVDQKRYGEYVPGACYDFVPITDPTLDSSHLAVGPLTLGVTDFRDVTGGVYKARERIHRAIADARLLANPAS